MHELSPANNKDAELIGWVEQASPMWQWSKQNTPQNKEDKNMR